MRTITPVSVEGTEVLPKIGDVVRIDGRSSAAWERLLPGDDFSDSGYPGCDFRLPVRAGGPIESVAVNVHITGRTIQWHSGAQWVRIRIEFVGDCEPSTYSSGWLRI
jgi:hypothetical protein